MNERVLLTGATGFLASHCIVKLVEAGFHVRGTVRSLERGQALVKRVPLTDEQRARVELVVADLSRDDGWAEAMHGCRFVMHVASPVPGSPPKDPQTVIRPAREGTVRVLKAAIAAKVERVVMTSSTAAVVWGNSRDGSKTYDERQWTTLGPDVGAYETSKTLAEKDAWETVKGTATELVTINPALIVGPVMDPDASVSGEVVRLLLAREVPGVPDLGYAMVDVRDVATVQVQALTKPGIAGKRFLVGGRHVQMEEVAQLLSKHFGPRGFKVPTRRIPRWVLKVVALWQPAARLTANELGKRQDITDALARKTFDYTPRSFDESLIAMGESMVALGVVRSPR
ncbi:MAG: NAD-dependent epimerase/dehydratase family protein [Archangium sp.]